jgi:hypothetical protein
MRAALFTVLALGITCGLGCGNDDGSPSSSRAGAPGDTANAGSSGRGSEAAGGGAEDDASSVGSGGKAGEGNAGSVNAGGDAGSVNAGGRSSGCRSASECKDGGSQQGFIGAPQCLPPGQAAPTTCGATGWCGQCQCPPVQQMCMSDGDCNGNAPHCLLRGVQGGCVQCRTSADCQTGACSDGVCTPQCGAGDPCENPFVACGPELRCDAPLACQMDAACPVNGACLSNVCARRPCQTDAQCDGACVNGHCYDAPGYCFQSKAVY